MNLKRYVTAKTKIAKSQVVHSIVEHLRQSSAVGGFVKKNHATGRYMAVSDDLAREKVGHALRDALNVMKRSQQRAAHDPYKFELNSRENIYEAEQAIFRSLDLYRGKQTSVIYEPDLNASLDVSSLDVSQCESSTSSTRASPVISI